ncbi:MAG TPA: hypothetical protein PKA19_01985 [Bacillota bacterium]|uniref:Uncharacterized protein n=1 Tax=Sinanaerobacter chloroacetimidivorans TaxID=2818044 RepID=A0A8J8B1E8_9FIRM|nr:hypothetical protein [Sinanaerobacter chloroacetimidivorans]MBR0597652.1 hypothetical protein [Sinanaerobacter chloroacetimidivorans]HML36181.1 hypothetical protein [Bacillota bacterium]
MIVRYRKNKNIAHYDSESFTTTGKRESIESLHGPFKSCGECPYPSHGFICYRSEGDCLRTDVEKIQRKNRKEEVDV